MMGDMASWTRRLNDAGPISLGLRHLHNDGRVFRAIVYDKGAWVLHALRRLVGDEAFARSLKGFQEKRRFTKVGTADLRAALEEASGLSLAPYFESWVYSTDLPVLSVTKLREAVPKGVRTTVTVKAQGLPGPVPLTIDLRLDEGKETHVERLTPEGGRWEYVTASPPRKVEVNSDLGLLTRRDD
jgi:aminopeptidase N